MTRFREWPYWQQVLGGAHGWCRAWADALNVLGITRRRR